MSPTLLRPFLYGLASAHPDSPFTDTATLYERTGHNTGNLAFHHAIRGLFGGDIDVHPWTTPADRLPGADAVGLVPCANQLGPHVNFGEWAPAFRAAPMALAGIGLGAQAGTDGRHPEVPAGTLDWVRAMAEHAVGKAPNIGVRGPFTREVLERHGLADHVEVLGCPTLFLNPDPHLGRTIASRLVEPRRIAVASGHQRWKHLARIEDSLAQMVTATHGSYVGQSPLEMVELTRGEADRLSPEALAECRDYACPGMDLDEFARWSRAHGQVFFDVPSWMEHYRRFDFVIGTRIHGIMLGLQAGVPSLCIAHDSRTIELCRTMGVPHVLARDVIHGVRRSQLLKLFDFDPDAFDRRRHELGAAFHRFFAANRLQPAPWFDAFRAPGPTGAAAAVSAPAPEALPA